MLQISRRGDKSAQQTPTTRFPVRPDVRSIRTTDRISPRAVAKRTGAPYGGGPLQANSTTPSRRAAHDPEMPLRMLPFFTTYWQADGAAPGASQAFSPSVRRSNVPPTMPAVYGARLPWTPQHRSAAAADAASSRDFGSSMIAYSFPPYVTRRIAAGQLGAGGGCPVGASEGAWVGGAGDRVGLTVDGCWVGKRVGRRIGLWVGGATGFLVGARASGAQPFSIIVFLLHAFLPRGTLNVGDASTNTSNAGSAYVNANRLIDAITGGGERAGEIDGDKSRRGVSDVSSMDGRGVCQ
jgi:hypothetical protein